MHRTYFQFNHLFSSINYAVSGRGSKALLVFHGYGHTSKNMKVIEDTLEDEYKIYSFDLFCHGFSEWNYGEMPLSKKRWRDILLAFLTKHEIRNFAVMGFSLGGKVALSTIELMPQRIEKAFLIAPDGVGNNFWYNFITSKFLKSLFRRTVSKPQLFKNLVQLLSITGIINKSTLRFSTNQMNSRDKRRRVYYTWMIYKGLSPDLPKVISDINSHFIEIVVYLGIYDRIIKQSDITSFASKISKCKVFQSKSGHNNLLEEVALLMRKELSKG